MRCVLGSCLVMAPRMVMLRFYWSTSHDVQTGPSCPQVGRPTEVGTDTGAWKTDDMSADAPRFLTLADVAEILNVTSRQVYALVRTGDLRGIQIGGRGQWRVEDVELEDYIQRQYDRADQVDRRGCGISQQGRQVPLSVSAAMAANGTVRVRPAPDLMVTKSRPTTSTVPSTDMPSVRVSKVRSPSSLAARST